MLNLENYKKSRFYREIRREILIEIAKKLSKHGYTAETIAEIVGFDLDVVKDVLKNKKK